jgi:PPOX class probable F420-dependent enzyme
MREMSESEWREFIMRGTHTGKIATVREDGRPHVVPVWFLLRDDGLFFTTWHTTVKAKDMHRDPRVAICIDDETFPFSFVMIEGQVEILDPTAEEFVNMATEIARRYVGDDQAADYGKRNAVPGELLIRVVPENVISASDLAE